MTKRVRKRVQTWPMKYVNQATVIKSQNELLLLDLLIDYKQLKLGSVDRLKEDLPRLKELIAIVYQAAEQVDGTFNHKSPLWADVSYDIITDYPGARTRLAALEKKLSAGNSLKEIRQELILTINTVAKIHADILRIPLPKPPPGDEVEPEEEAPIILDIKNLNLIRSSGDFNPGE